MKKSHFVPCDTWQITPGLTLGPLPGAVLPENRGVRVYSDTTVFMAYQVFSGRKTVLNRPPADHPGSAGWGPSREDTRKRPGRHSRQDIRQKRSWHFTGHREGVPEKNKEFLHNRKEER